MKYTQKTELIEIIDNQHSANQDSTNSITIPTPI